MDSRSLLVRNLIFCTGLASVFAISVGGLAIIGWLLNIPEFMSILPGFPTMKFNTGLCFMLSGMSLWLWYRHDITHPNPTGISRLAAIITSSLVIWIAGVTFSQYLFGWNSGLDELFIQAGITDAAAPGRMSAITALGFILIGCSLIFLSGNMFWTLISQIFSLIAAIIASLVLLAYLFKADLEQVSWFSSIALHTAAGLWVLGLGVLALRSDHGFMHVYTQDTNSARMGRWFLLSSLLVMPLIAELRIIGQRNFDLYDTYFGVAIVTVASITALTLINWFKTRLGNIADYEISNLNRIYAVLSGINTLIVRTKNKEDLLNEACLVANRTGKFAWAWIVTIDPDSHKKTLAASEGGNELLVQTLRHSLVPGETSTPDNSVLHKALHSRKPVVINDIKSTKKSFARHPKSYIDLLRHGIKSLVLLPLVVEGKAVGVFALHSGFADFFDDQEMHLLIEMAGDISFAIHNLAKEDQLSYLAFYDPLTELVNRSYFISMLGKEIRKAANTHSKLTLILLDIRRFRTINDSLGRLSGDEILKIVADRLYLNAPQPETLARLQSDCFAMFHVSSRSSREEQGLYRRLQDCIGEPLSMDGQMLTLQTTMGMAIYPDDGQDSDKLLRNAEATLNKAKDTGQPFLFYEAQINALVSESFALENKLRTALEKDQFVLHYQPKVDFRRRDFNEVEALIRWNDPDKGLVPPGLFIPLLEQTGLILKVGKWAMQQAITDFRRWRELGLNAPRIAVNVSAVQLRDKAFTGTVVNLLTEFGDAEPMLDLELTESMVMENVQRAGITFKTLRTLGVEISIDDFGTGHSSLAYLARLPINTLKIDRSFVLGMTEADGGIALVSAIISLGHSLHLKVIAEGVETEEQASKLQELHCDQMQGYLFSKPVPFDELAKMLSKKTG